MSKAGGPGTGADVRAAHPATEPSHPKLAAGGKQNPEWGGYEVGSGLEISDAL